jgi:uncharacterized protein (DUF952 family)
MKVTYHLVPADEWEASDPGRPYVPTAFARDGFVHCTNGADEVAATANRYYSSASDLVVLTIDVSKIDAPVRYEGPNQMYPHVYGAIPRTAITHVQPLRRDHASWAMPA